MGLFRLFLTLLPVVGAFVTGNMYMLISPIVLLLFRNRKAIYYGIYNLPRDLHLVWATGSVLLDEFLLEKQDASIPKLFAKRVAKHPDKVALIHQDREVTFRQVEEYSNRVGRFFKERGFLKGDVVAVLLETRPEYPALWLGLTKVGCVAALINTNQRDKALLHSVGIAKSRALVYGSELKTGEGSRSRPPPRHLDGLSALSYSCPAVEEISEELEGVELYCLGGDLDPLLAGTSPASLDQEVADVGFKDKALYIYTSGTTGLPKAAIINHARCLFMAKGAHTSQGMTAEDVVYTPLPLYHSAGGLIGVGQMLVNGNTVVLRSKFSASQFWSDCIKHKCTVAQYIGEICRYLLAVPPSSLDRAHNVRIMTGNGLRPQIWAKFVERFGIKKIGEFYGATEGNASMINCWNKVGAVGYVPWFAERFYPIRLIKVDEETNEPIRGEDGFCIPVQVGEPGLLVGKIDPKRVVMNFSGYADHEATNKKILRDVFTKGDSVFNTGDILVRDDYGYFFFRDRTGDTYRWRGENVATSEVEAIVSNIMGLRDCIVYGVEVPGTEGRAGMAAVLDEEGVLDLHKLEAGLRKSLSAYARPLFLRVLKQLPITGTFKLKKGELVKEGYDPRAVSDRLYFLDQKTGSYVALTPELFRDITTGALRL